MGCSEAKEKIQDKIMFLKLERTVIRVEKEKQLNKLSEIEGHIVQPSQIPDYIDPIFAKEKNIYEDNNEFCFVDKTTNFNSNNQNRDKEPKEKSKGTFKGKRKRKRKSKNKEKLK